jgi:U32 family peptidase
VSSQQKIPELLLPAGSFDSALAAIEGGADALYFGFSDFSARKQARNFDRLEYRRLRRYAREKGVRLYAALNTIVLQSEMEGIAELLAFIGRFPPDAVLVQDWGLASLIRSRHPGIAVHASTQAAVQGASAARIACELGATRVVLPRETSLAEMRRIHTEEPGIELEAFVHGALCYSFSGLCLASGMVLGRSGNRGECAQLCRSYYDVEGSAGFAPGFSAGKRGYWFSCRDLELGGRVGELASAGISSLKVEGRMKSPEYCYAVARLYRGYIDALSGAGPDVAEMNKRLEEARTAFSRSPSEAWLFERGGSHLIDSSYPGHRGVSAGFVSKVSGSRLTLDLAAGLGLRDGLLGFEGGDESRPLRFPALGLRDPSTGRDTFSAEAGAKVELELKADDGSIPAFKPGDELRKISSRELDRRAASPEEYECDREELELRLLIGPEGIGAELALPRFDAKNSAGKEVIGRGQGGQSLVLDAAKNPGGFERALAVFGESGEADFRLCPSLDEERPVVLKDGRELRAHDLFIPPSALKKEKNRIYAEASRIVEGSSMAYALESAALCDEAAKAAGPLREAPPPRASLVFPRDELPSGMPFATPRCLILSQELPRWGSRSYLPLAPLVLDRDAYEGLVRERVKSVLAGGVSLAIGLGALHHLALGRKLAADNPEAGERLSFFLDFNFYVANSLAYASLSSLLGGIEFAYRYLESEGEEPDAEGTRLAPIGEHFEPPLFQSLGCAKKHHLSDGACAEDCDRSYSCILSDRDRRYRLIVEDCVTYLFRLGAERKSLS